MKVTKMKIENIEELYLDDILEYKQGSTNTIQEVNDEEPTLDTLKKIAVDLKEMAEQKTPFKEKISEFVVKKFHNGQIEELQHLYEKIQPINSFYTEAKNTLVKWKIESESERDIDSAPLQAANEDIEELFSTFKAYQEKISYHITVLSEKQDHVEKALFNLVKDTSVELQERTKRMVPLMEEQEEINRFIQDLKNVIAVVK
jgi:hypothetical protein